MARGAYHDAALQWDALLPFFTAAYNSTLHSVTGMSPDYVELGRHLVQPWQVNLHPGQGLGTSDLRFVRDRVIAMRMGWEVAQQALHKAEGKRLDTSESKYRTPKFAVGDHVLVLRHSRASKMEFPWAGPYPITEVLSRDRYRLEFHKPKTGIRAHDVIPVARLRKWTAEQGEFDVEDGWHVVSKIVDRRRGAANLYEYRVRWMGFGADSDTWVKVDDMTAELVYMALDFDKSQGDVIEDGPGPHRQPPGRPPHDEHGVQKTWDSHAGRWVGRDEPPAAAAPAAAPPVEAAATGSQDAPSQGASSQPRSGRSKKQRRKATVRDVASPPGAAGPSLDSAAERRRLRALARIRQLHGSDSIPEEGWECTSCHTYNTDDANTCSNADCQLRREVVGRELGDSQLQSQLSTQDDSPQDIEVTEDSAGL